MTIDERDKIRKETEIPGEGYDGMELPVSDCGDPLQDIINDIITRLKHDAKFLDYVQWCNI